MEIVAILAGLCGGCAAGYLAVPGAPEWVLPWLVVSVVYFSWLFVSVIKTRISPVFSLAGLLVSAGLMAVERLSGVFLSPAVIFFWVFCLYRGFGSGAAAGAEF